MIRSRQSNDHLHSDIILSRISEYDIFKYYCSGFKQLGKKFCSDLRQDNSPTVSIIQWRGKLLYKDFGNSDHSFDCFSYVMAKYNCAFYNALLIIDNDFGLRLASHKSEQAFTTGYLGFRSNKKLEDKKLTIIRKKSRSWEYKDAKFWKQYLINKKTLIKFAVQPISYYWINDHRFRCNLSYAFKIGSKYKIYSPHDEVKWISNTTSKHIQGWDQLPEKGNIIIITSSLKDIMCLRRMGFPGIAMQSEMQMLGEKTIKDLKKRFKEVVILYDNDFTNSNNPGQTMAIKICEKYDLKNIYIPESYQVKDISDCIAKFGSFDKALEIIKSQL